MRRDKDSVHEKEQDGQKVKSNWEEMISTLSTGKKLYPHYLLGRDVIHIIYWEEMITTLSTGEK